MPRSEASISDLYFVTLTENLIKSHEKISNVYEGEKKEENSDRKCEKKQS